MRLNVLVLIVVFCFSVQSSAAGFEQGVSAYRNGQHQQAFKIWQRLARNGDRRAQYYLSFMYTKGVGTVKSAARASHWLHKAAENGLAAAQLTLGLMYLDGH